MCFDYDDAEAPQFASVSIVKCRKPRKCQECGGDINAGELAEYQSGLFDGEFYHDHYCGACEATRKAIADKETAEGCYGIEIWCPKGGLAVYCHDTGFARATVEDGQRYLAKMRERYRAKKQAQNKR
jgi:hypothetical protein